MKKYSRGEIAKIILSTLLVVGVMVIVIAAPGITKAAPLFKYFKPKNAAERAKIKRSLARLEKNGFIERTDSIEDAFVLTTKGEIRASRERLASMKIERQKKWDSKWRIVMFDIPENKVQSRRAINLALKKFGCIQYQKSVFITPFPCKKEIDFVGRCFDVRNYVRLIVADSIEGESTLKKSFGL